MARNHIFLRWLAAVGLVLVLCGSLYAAQSPATDPGAIPTPAPASAPTAAPGATGTGGGNAPDAGAAAPADAPKRMDIVNAIEGLVDEDEPTRRRAFERLNDADAADIPTLEKYAHSKDPEIRRQVDLILKRLKRGTLAFTLQYPDGKPVVGMKFSVLMYQADQVNVQKWNNRVQVTAKPPRGGLAKEDFEADVTSDANGLITVGRFNDGKYMCLVEAGDPLPTQIQDVTVHLQEDTAPLKVEFKRGVTLTVTVVDADGKPVPDATVLNVDQEGNLRNLEAQSHNSQMLQMLARQFTSVTTDAKGVAVLDKIGLGEIHPVAFKEGYDTMVGDKQEIADGGKGAVTLKLVKTKPVAMEMRLIDQTNGKPLKNMRAVMVENAKLMAVFGARWFAESKESQIADYVKNGAIDLKSSDNEGKIKGEYLPETYMMLGFSGTTVYYGQVSIAGHGGSTTVRMQPIRR